jgi:hypothetical protein
MYVIHDCVFTPDVGGFDRVVVPGVYSADQFSSITNITRNTVLYVSTDEHMGSITVSDDGVQTTVLVYPATPVSDPTDDLQVLAYNDAPGTAPGPAANVAVTNWPASQNINGTVSVNGEVEVKNDAGNPLAVSGTISVGNFPATQPVSGSVSVSNFPATQPVSGSVSVSNFPATQAVSGTVNVGNFPASVEVSNDVGNPLPVSGTVTVNQGTSPWVVSSTGGSTNISSFPATGVDAFGRLRVSEPFTLFESSFRYGDNQLWSTATATGGAAVYNTAQGLMDLNVTTASGSSVRRQTTKVFAYQPGKSLLILTTFVCATPKANLDQKVGYYSSDNGYYFEQDGLTSYFVERSAVSGAVTDTRVAQADWNVDPLDGSGPSGITLDITKAQILWMDLQWLGVGTVRMGFVINDAYIICHEWQHANIISSTYTTTASLPLSCEITNAGITASASTFKQICATVISEGGFALTGLQQSVGTSITAPRTLTLAGTFYPIVSLRLKTSRLDAIAILTAVSILGNGNNETFRWEVRAAGTTTGGSWLSAGVNSSVEYNLTGTAYTGGRILAAGYTSSSNQGSPSVDILKQALFANQLERDPFTAAPYEITLVMAGANPTTSCFASMDWEEISR